MKLVDSRRLTGPNLHDASPGAIAELTFEAGFDSGDVDDSIDAFIAAWRGHVAEVARCLGWSPRVHARRISAPPAASEGVELMLTAEVDQLYTATEVNEWAIAHASGTAGTDTPSLDELRELAREEREQRTGARELIARAELEGVPWLIDDERLSLGYMARSRVWAMGSLPDPEGVDWQTIASGDPKVALITGTNGKTTTTRLLARMAMEAGLQVGNTSTDGLAVNGAITELGDWTGPGGARAVLRDRELDVAVLEAARGGLLRRGVGASRCDVAVITNVARDHLGEYGIFDLEGMAAAKGIVAKSVVAGGRLVLDAHSPALVAWGQRQISGGPEQVWVSTDPHAEVFVRHTRAGGEGWTLLDGDVVRIRSNIRTPLCPVDSVTIGLGGRARYNLANALAACAAAEGLGLGWDAIRSALRSFGQQPSDNPGRAGLWSIGEVGILVDFAHNEAGMEAVFEMIRSFGRPIILCFGMAGDRSDADLRELGSLLSGCAPRRVILRDQGGFLRGRALGEVPKRMAEGLLASGFPAALTEFAADEARSIERGLERAEPGDWIVLLAHAERDEVARFLASRGASPAQPPIDASGKDPGGA